MSDLEKHASSRDEREHQDIDLPDPDAHLSQEERDQIVSFIPIPNPHRALRPLLRRNLFPEQPRSHD